MTKERLRVTLGYARVSTDGQAESGLGLDAQETRVRAFAAAYGHDLAALIIDAGQSAKSLARPGVRELIDQVRAGKVARVIVAKLDRLTRSTRDLQNLLELFEQHRVALVSVAETLDTETAAGRLVLNVMAAVASWEREAIAERTREALAAKRSKGERTGTVPYGHCVGSQGAKLLAEAGEQRVLARVHELREAGAPLVRIAEALNREGFTTRTGNAWKYQHVQQLVTPADVRRGWRRATERRKARAALAPA